VTRWQPCVELTQMLETLSDDIMTASDEDVRQMHGRKIASTAREVRLLIKAARAGKDRDLPPGVNAGSGEPGASLQPPQRGPHHQRH
jgi:hypothetical protein